ncbi:MAG: tetratricopeptide repeat protein, partial [Pseudomonadota bacterium]|nr:tetratricopeptide repeat protein [Pseudomonadota bacterium]
MTDLRSSLDRALQLERSGDAAGARREAEAALAGDPNNPQLLQFLGRLSCRNGRLAEGEAYLRKSFELVPDAIEVRADLAMALAALGRGDEALPLCDEGAAAAGGAFLTRIRGQILQSMNRHAAAAEAYERVVELESGDWEAWNNLGSVRWALGDLAGAVTALRRAAALRPHMVPIHANLGAILAAAGELEEALAAYQRALALAPGEPRLVINAAKLLRQLGRHQQALDFLRAAPNDPDVEIERGRSLSALRRLDQAEQAYRSAIRGRRGFVEAHLELGLVLERAGRVHEVEPLLAQAGADGVAAESLGYLRALLLESQ